MWRSRSASPASDARWALRRRRAERLQGEHPAAGELLRFYRDLIDVQAPVFDRASRSRWLAALAAPAGDTPRLRLARLPAACAREFVTFIAALPASAPGPLRATAERLTDEPALAARLLEVAVHDPVAPPAHELQPLAAALGCEAPLLTFFSQAFLQPVAEAGAATLGAGGSMEGRGARVCPACGALPLVAVLRDEPEIKGRRTLLCARCAVEWTFSRTGCARCGESAAAALKSYVTDVWPHVRVDDCASCRTYLKTIDLRTVGLAVPAVDELASVELDLWAAGQGLTKLQPNVLGV